MEVYKYWIIIINPKKYALLRHDLKKWILYVLWCIFYTWETWIVCKIRYKKLYGKKLWTLISVCMWSLKQRGCAMLIWKSNWQYNKQMEWAQIQKEFTLKAPGTYLLCFSSFFQAKLLSEKPWKKIQIICFSLATQRVPLNVCH